MEDERTPLLSASFGNGPSHATGLVPNDRSREFRTLILCFDGTGDKDDDDVTNVIELRNMLYGWDKGGDGDPEVQQVHYQRGIGTFNPLFPGTNVHIPIVNTVFQTIDQAIAWSLEYHIIAGYKWLADRYRPGDKICIFGFSRGAYTARALAGMLGKVGLIPAGSPQSIAKAAFDSYERHLTPDAWEHSNKFRMDMKCRNVVVEFLGCWDTVNSVGLITARRLPFTAYNKIVRNFRHAVSLDERRARFRTNMWSRPKDDNFEKNKTTSANDGKANGVQNGANGNGIAVKTNGSALHDVKKREPPVTVKTDADEVWFAGCHCDIGGGSVPNGTRPNLSHIPLRWMIRECFKTKSGIVFTKAGLLSFGLDPDSLYPYVQPRPPALTLEPETRANAPVPAPGLLSRVGSWISSWNPFSSKKKELVMYGFEEGAGILTEEQLDMRDALAPIYDQLVRKWWKWILLEVYPMKMWSTAKQKYERKRNHGRGRRIPPPLIRNENSHGDPRWYKVRVHRTVRTKMGAIGKDGIRYEPSALLDGVEGETLSKLIQQGLVEWVD